MSISDDQKFSTRGCPDQVPPMLDATLEAPGPNSAVITWTTSEPATARVSYGPTSRYGAVAPSDAASFTRTVIDPTISFNGHKPKAVGDFGNEGLASVANQTGGQGMNIFRYPGWTRCPISTIDLGGGAEDARVADVNNDGALDIVEGGFANQLVWFENPLRQGKDPFASTWDLHTIGAYQCHDIVPGDVNQDGRIDLATESGVALQQSPASWLLVGQPNINRRTPNLGTALADLTGDGTLDLLAVSANEHVVWFENPLHLGGNPALDTWIVRDIGAAFDQSSITVADVNADGRKDVLMTPQEVPGGLVWFEGPANPRSGPWVVHAIDPSLSSVHQGVLQLADFNLDGVDDMAFAEQEQADLDRVGVLYRTGRDGLSWTMQVLGTSGGHNMRLAPVGDDMLPSLLNTNHGHFQQLNPLELYRPNQPAMTTAHAVKISGLACATSYHYQAVSYDAALNRSSSSDRAVTTSPCPADGAPPAISGRSVAILPTEVTVSWITNEAATQEVEYGSTSAYGASAARGGFAIAHAVHLCGLSCSGVYHYRVLSNDPAGNRAASPDGTFTTAACAASASDHVPAGPPSIPLEETPGPRLDAANAQAENWLGSNSLDLTIVGEGQVVRNPEKTGYQCGEQVTLSAAPASGWWFTGWRGALTSGVSPVSISMIADQHVAAVFAPIDADGDGAYDLQDNCPSVANSGQGDADADGAGNACDNCPNLPNPDQADRDGNGEGDACQPVSSDVFHGDPRGPQ